jgi:peptidoglycan hydrolase-like protein with peptidoglycan-binding domain
VGRNTWSKLLNKNVGNVVVKNGDEISDVLFLQRLLLSYLYPITNLDSDFGPETERAVRAFQQENGLTVDGIVGPKTWNKLFSSKGRSL